MRLRQDLASGGLRSCASVHASLHIGPGDLGSFATCLHHVPVAMFLGYVSLPRVVAMCLRHVSLPALKWVPGSEHGRRGV